MQIGSGYTKRDLCDGQTLVSRVRWPVELRNYPEHETWLFVAGLYTDFDRRVGTPTLLTSLALGKVSESQAADLKRVMREKARLGEKTFALTADVAEAHRQIPIHPRDWHLLGSQIEVGGDVYMSEPSESPPPRTTGHAQPQHSATSWSQTTFTLRRADQTTVQHWSRSLSSARPLEYLSPGGRQLAETKSRG